MFLRSTPRKKDGKEHRYYSVVESSRPSRGAPPHQRTLLYLGEINSEQQSAWIKAIEVFDTQSKCQQTFSLVPSDKTIPANLAAPGLQIRVDQYELTRPRQYGACWLGCDLWRRLNLDEFWRPNLGVSREGTDWTSLLQVFQSAVGLEFSRTAGHGIGPVEGSGGGSFMASARRAMRAR